MTPWYKIVSRLEAKGEAYTLITLLGTTGSTPRDSGTKMVVAAGQAYGTIGGGHLEFKALALARDMLNEKENQQKVEHFPLGTKLGQCCGGSATVLFESFVGADLNIMLFGAGHVGRSLMGILAQLPCRLYWVDSRGEEFPDQAPDNVIKEISSSPADEVSDMPANSYYIVMTHNHALDYSITEAVLKRDDARYIGLIGSETKWRRFKARFEHRGHAPGFYLPVRCPIGLSNVPGKKPVEVAVSIAGEIIADYQNHQVQPQSGQGVIWGELKAKIRSMSTTDTSQDTYSIN